MPAPATEPEVLMVHLYGFTDESDLGPMSRAVCEEIVRVAHKYKWIILLGGWHDRTKKSRPTSAEIAYAWLVSRGISPQKLVTQFTIGGIAATKMPARNTSEEVDLAGQILLHLFPGEDPKSIPFPAIGLWFHRLRIWMLWLSRHANYCGFVSASSPQTRLFAKGMLLRVMQEPPGWLLTLADPYGQRWFFRKLNFERTHIMETDEQWSCNSHHVWKDLRWPE